MSTIILVPKTRDAKQPEKNCRHDYRAPAWISIMIIFIHQHSVVENKTKIYKTVTRL